MRNIRHLMKQRGLSGNKLADFSGLSRSYVAALLGERPLMKGRNPSQMTLATLDKFAVALDVNPVVLLITESPR